MSKTDGDAAIRTNHAVWEFNYHLQALDSVLRARALGSAPGAYEIVLRDFKYIGIADLCLNDAFYGFVRDFFGQRGFSVRLNDEYTKLTLEPLEPAELTAPQVSGMEV